MADADGSIDDVIVVAGYSDRYAAAVKHVLAIERGFVDDPVDRGGATKFGISLRFLASEGAFDDDANGIAEFDLDMDGDIDGQDIRKLTRGHAVYLYHRCFWLALDCDVFDAPIGEMLFDQGVNGGRSSAGKLLQRAINQALLRFPQGPGRPSQLAVDGKLGTMTRGALVLVLRLIGMDELCELFREAVRERYRSIAFRNPSQQRFLKGWLARADRLGRS